MDRSCRRSQPCADPVTVVRKGGLQHGPMRRNPPLVGPIVADHHPCRHRAGDPSSIASDLGRQPALASNVPDQLLDIDELGLQFDHEEGGCCCMPGEDIDHTPLAIDRERDLGRGFPPAEAGEEGGDRFMERRVASVDEAVEVASMPAHRHVNPDSEDVTHGTQELDRARIQITTLEGGQRRPRHADTIRHVLLPPAAPDPHASKGPADHDVLHFTRMASCTYLRRTSMWKSTPIGPMVHIRQWQ